MQQNMHFNNGKSIEGHVVSTEARTTNMKVAIVVMASSGIHSGSGAEKHIFAMEVTSKQCHIDHWKIGSAR